MPNKTQIITAITVVGVMVLYNFIAPKIGFPSL